MGKLLKSLLSLVLFLSLTGLLVENADAAGKVMWGKTELKLGQIGKVTVLSQTNLVKLEADGTLTTVRQLKKGEEFRVYSYKGNDGGLYGVGGGSFVPKNQKVRYETPSKAKLNLLKQQPAESKPNTGNQSDGYYVNPNAPKSFKNCTALREYYPNGVAKSHPAYASKHDRDNDGWACER